MHCKFWDVLDERCGGKNRKLRDEDFPLSNNVRLHTLPASPHFSFSTDSFKGIHALNMSLSGTESLGSFYKYHSKGEKMELASNMQCKKYHDATQTSGFDDAERQGYHDH